MAHAAFDWSIIAYIFVASLNSWLYALSGSIFIRVVKDKTVDAVEAFVPFSWLVVVPTAGSAGVVALTVWDGFGIAFILIASLYSWDSAVPGSIFVLWVEFETLTFCTGDALKGIRGVIVIATSSARLMAGAVSDWLAVFLFIASGFDFFFDAGKEQSDNVGWCSHLCFCFWNK